MLSAGFGGVNRHGCVALSDAGNLIGVCEQERATRVRSAGFNATGLPDEALDMLLQRNGRTRADVRRYLMAEPDRDNRLSGAEHVDHHLAHACAAYLSSPFTAAAIVVCDHEAQKVSVWEGCGADVRSVEWPWDGPGFADLYSQSAAALGFGGNGADQRMEALARLRPDNRDDRLARLWKLDAGLNRLALGIGWEQQIVDRTVDAAHAGSRPQLAGTAAALQARIIELFLELLHEVRRRTDCDDVCLAGSLFYHSAINTAAKRDRAFERVFIPIDPGNAGLAVGTALYADRRQPATLSPFLGPAYTPNEVKETLDNCKLSYSWESEANVIAIVVDALMRGRLVGWFDGAMEWGPRALGGRCILANPFSPFVLENLNRFLKRREPWRGYALSGLDQAVRTLFDGPADASFMECDYRPVDAERFRHVLPDAGAVLRAHTCGPQTPPRFQRLLQAFGVAAGAPVLVNTSFNGFHEPIVCNPRDAVRVFYGTGLDLLAIDQFLLRK